MPKIATVTISVTVTADIPKSWTEDDLFDKVSEAITVDVKSNTKRVTVTEVDVDVDDVEAEEEDD